LIPPACDGDRADGFHLQQRYNGTKVVELIGGASDPWSLMGHCLTLQILIVLTLS
jgi:hypothetical protein